MPFSTLSRSRTFQRESQVFPYKAIQNSRQSPITIHPSKHYLQVFFVVVVHYSQEERHEDISVDNDKGDEEQGIPRTEVKSRHPRGGERDCYLLGRQTGK